MSSLRRIAASRANGALSRGPKTPHTRQISAANSISHGLTANRERLPRKTVLLANECPERFQQALDAYFLRLQPRDASGPLVNFRFLRFMPDQDPAKRTMLFPNEPSPEIEQLPIAA